MFRIFFLPAKSASEMSFRSMFASLKSGALLPGFGSSPLVLTGLPLSVTVAMDLSLCGLLERRRQRAGVVRQVGLGLGLGRAHQQRVAQLGIVLRQVIPAVDALPRELGQHRADRAV